MDGTEHLDETPRRERRWLRRTLWGLAISVALVAAAPLIGVGTIYFQGHSGPGGDGEFVALGSSFGAGPGVQSRADGSPTLCLRSARNYAHDLAAMRKLQLVDATCSGATAKQVLRGGQYFQPPQVNSVGPHTRLVTITAGGNDVSYLPNMFGWSCQNNRSGTPLFWRPLVCETTAPQQEAHAFGQLRATFDQIIAAVRQRAPRTEIVIVDYTTVLPPARNCPDRVPLTSSEFDRARAAADRLKTLTAEVAARNKVTLVKASELTAGHDVCSAQPWVFDYTYPATPLNFGPIPYHPTVDAMRRIAAALDESIRPDLRN